MCIEHYGPSKVDPGFVRWMYLVQVIKSHPRLENLRQTCLLIKHISCVFEMINYRLSSNRGPLAVAQTALL